MKFYEITMQSMELITEYCYAYGGGSCQYAFPPMLGLKRKYGDEYCIEDGVLYVHRSGRDTDGNRVYLIPLMQSEEDFAVAVSNILKDAGEHGSRAVFETVCQSDYERMEAAFPGLFEAKKNRDMAEYVYERETLSSLKGRNLAAKRNRITKFYETYGHENIRIQSIGSENIEAVRAFQKSWLLNKQSELGDGYLSTEDESIQFYLDHFTELGFEGIVVEYSGNVIGYAAGIRLSETCMDEVIEKGNTEYVGIYQVLCNEFAVRCGAPEVCYVNREEDVGVEGLRRSKLSYQPAFLLEKYELKEKKQDWNTLSPFINSADCASCRFCCSFRRCSIWETPIFTEENLSAIKAQDMEKGTNLSAHLVQFKTSGRTYARYDLTNAYKTQDSEEEVACPYLDTERGCILNEAEKPWDCKIWPLRVAKKKSGEIVIALTPTCPAVNKHDVNIITNYVNQHLRDRLLAYAMEHPQLIKEFEEDFFIEIKN